MVFEQKKSPIWEADKLSSERVKEIYRIFELLEKFKNMKQGINGSSVCRFADIEILRYTIDDFESLSLNEKLLVYHLSEAGLAGRDIIFDQNGVFNLRLRKLFEGLLQHYKGNKEGQDFLEMKTYLYRLWFSSGIHHHYGSDKFEPNFSKEWLRNAIASVQNEGYLLQFQGRELDEMLDEVFDPERSPKRTEQSGDEDLLQASCANFYDKSISQKEAEDFYQLKLDMASEEERQAPPSYGLNTRLNKDSEGKLYEEPYRIGGLYGECLEAISTHLKSALAYTQTERQREAILTLLEYYKTGNLELYNKFCILWVGDTETQIDFINGFTETYTDPLGMTGAFEGLVHIRNQKASERTEKICREANWFEANAPIPQQYKKAEAKGISASVVTLAMLSGDSYPATPIGINLPNADWIRAEHGSKSVSIENIHEAYRIASASNGMDEAFVPNAEIRELLAQYGGITECLHTDLHECLGHGSGKLREGVSPDALGAYASTIEEARADLFALYYMADDKLIELGLLPNKDAHKACYYRYLLNGLITQLVRIPLGKNLEEAHMRNRALIARYVLERAEEEGNKAVELNGVELIINDYTAMRGFIAELLHEVQRVKSEGDIAKAKALVENYGVKIDKTMHKQILERYAKLNIAPYRGFVNPRLDLVFEDGGIVDVVPNYTEGYEEQMLRYSKDYSFLSENPCRIEEHKRANLSDKLQKEVKALRSGLRQAMDGVVASSMRKKGLHYGVNFGLTLEHIKARADKLPKSAELARYLLSRDVRELKIIGQMIYPTEELNFTDACYIASKVFSNVELRDYLAKNLFDRVLYAPQWATAWLLDEEGQYEDLEPLAYIVLARHLMRGYRVPSEAITQRLLDKAFATLSKDDEERITMPRSTALLFVKRWGRNSEIAQRILARPELKAWQKHENPILKEFADDIIFELNFH